MRKFFLFAFVLPSTMLLCSSYQKVDNSNSKNALVGSWESVRSYRLDSMFHDDRKYGLGQYYKVHGPDTTFWHGMHLTLTFKSDYTYVANYSYSIFDEDGDVRGTHSGTDTSTYTLLPGKLVLLDPNLLLVLCEPHPQDTAARPPLDNLDYMVANGILTLHQSCEGYSEVVNCPYKTHRTVIFKKR